MYFTDKELQCPCCGEQKMDPGFMLKLNNLRKDCGFPFVITSAYRCEKHNKEVGGKSGSAHVKGKAVDILCYGGKAFEIVSKAKAHQMTGIGVSQNGPHEKRFVHIDDDIGDTRPWLWSY